MKWKKLGLIFQPSQFSLVGQPSEFAQSPQALVLHDRVRVFFSTREREPGGKFLSHIAFADFAHDMRTIIEVSTAPVIPLGALGTFDEHGIFPMNVVRNGNVIYGYTSGWSRRVSVSVETSIGLAISHNEGRSFQRTGDGPILTSSLHEPCLVGDPFVLRTDAGWHMWYIFGVRWIAGAGAGDPNERVYKIAHATSPDGLTWHKEGRAAVADRLDADECQALPTVIEHGGQHHMYFCYRYATGFRADPARGYRIGYAYSDDLRTWTRADAQAGIGCSTDGWDSEMMCYPHIFRCDDRVYLLYNGNAFGRGGFGAAILEP